MGGGDQIFGRLGGELFGRDLKNWEKPVGGGPNPLGHCGSVCDRHTDTQEVNSYVPNPQGTNE